MLNIVDLKQANEYLPFHIIVLKDQWISDTKIDEIPLTGYTCSNKIHENKHPYNNSKNSLAGELIYGKLASIYKSFQSGRRENLIKTILDFDEETKLIYRDIYDILNGLNKKSLEDFYKNPLKSDNRMTFKNIRFSNDDYSQDGGIQKIITLIIGITEKNVLRKKIRYETREWADSIFGSNKIKFNNNENNSNKLKKTCYNKYSNIQFNSLKPFNDDCLDNIKNSISDIISWRYVNLNEYGIFSYQTLRVFYSNIFKLYKDGGNNVKVNFSKFDKQLEIYDELKKIKKEDFIGSPEKIAKSFFPNELLKSTYLSELRTDYKRLQDLESKQKISTDSFAESFKSFLIRIIIFITYWLKLHARYIDSYRNKYKSDQYYGERLDGIIRSIEKFLLFFENCIAIKLGLERKEKSITLLKTKNIRNKNGKDIIKLDNIDLIEGKDTILNYEKTWIIIKETLKNNFETEKTFVDFIVGLFGFLTKDKNIPDSKNMDNLTTSDLLYKRLDGSIIYLGGSSFNKTLGYETYDIIKYYYEFLKDVEGNIEKRLQDLIKKIQNYSYCDDVKKMIEIIRQAYSRIRPLSNNVTSNIEIAGTFTHLGDEFGYYLKITRDNLIGMYEAERDISYAIRNNKFKNDLNYYDELKRKRVNKNLEAVYYHRKVLVFKKLCIRLWDVKSIVPENNNLNNRQRFKKIFSVENIEKLKKIFEIKTNEVCEFGNSVDEKIQVEVKKIIKENKPIEPVYDISLNSRKVKNVLPPQELPPQELPQQELPPQTPLPDVSIETNKEHAAYHTKINTTLHSNVNNRSGVRNDEIFNFAGKIKNIEFENYIKSKSFWTEFQNNIDGKTIYLVYLNTQSKRGIYGLIDILHIAVAGKITKDDIILGNEINHKFLTIKLRAQGRILLSGTNKELNTVKQWQVCIFEIIKRLQNLDEGRLRLFIFNIIMRRSHYNKLANYIFNPNSLLKDIIETYCLKNIREEYSKCPILISHENIRRKMGKYIEDKFSNYLK